MMVCKESIVPMLVLALPILSISLLRISIVTPLLERPVTMARIPRSRGCSVYDKRPSKEKRENRLRTRILLQSHWVILHLKKHGV